MKKMKIQKLFGSVLLLGVLSLASCDKEIPAGELSGEKVVVRFNVSGSPYSSSTIRSTSPSGQTVKVPVSEDLFVYATLESSLVAPARANVPLSDGAKVWVGAYSGTPSAGASPVASATYSYSVSSGTLVADNVGLEVQPGTYTFTAYSFNSSAALTTDDIDPTSATGGNLMWGSSSATISAQSASVGLTLGHKFPELSVVLSTVGYTGTPNISNISNVTVTPGNKATLDAATGTLTSGAAVTQTLTGWSGLGTTSVTSGSITVNTGVTDNDTPVTIAFGSIMIGSTVYSGTIAPEFDMNLDPSLSYTLTVNFKKVAAVKFAASNIYWDGNKLTFDPYTTTPSMSSMQKQGVVFKWGSLVGVSNPGTAGSSITAWNAGSAVYVPTDNSGTAWTATTATAKGWTAWTGTTGIPYVDDNYRSTSPTDSHLTTGVTADYATLKGDICQFIDPAYRMPTISEFGNNPNYNVGQMNSSFLATGANGQTLISCGVTYAPSNGMFFPASGYRRTDGAVYNVGYHGYYWTSSATSSTSSALLASFMYFNHNGAGPDQTNRWTAFVVRCVLK
ncbi:hypothetical protein FACS1894182_12370 [Bacteroidia bacterium]|nr:hypothetical protein FACS1894182_12370 [Bacteroidia bacterium]